jgi:hypothetical protein
MLAVLCQVAQEARDTDGMPEADQKLRFASELPEPDRLPGSRP